jgi:hypothetical protein
MSDPNAGLPPMPPAPKGAVTAAQLDVIAAQGFGPPPQLGGGPKSQEEAAAGQIAEANNPADSPEERMLRERGPRLSLNAPARRLDVPPIDGYHLHWFLERNIPRALQGWYEFVDPKEVPAVDRSIGGRTEGTNSEDLGGARVSQIGGMNEQGRPEQLVLMKIRQEWYFAEQRKIAERNLAIITQIFNKKTPVMAPEEAKTDYGMRYTREAVIDMSNGRFRKVD